MLKGVGDEGFEPATNRLRVYCSTVELVTHTKTNHIKILADLPVWRQVINYGVLV